MAHYAIMRGEKRKTGDARGCVAHITRTQPTPNADPEKTPENYALVGPSWDDDAGIHDAIEARTPDKYRKDAVRTIEFMITASPGWFEQNPERERDYFEAATEWFKSEFGAENVVSAVVHKDESSPHMHLLVVPRDESSGKPKLNAKGIFGNKGVLQGRQNRFADHMAHFGVERGKPDPTRKHTKIAEWRAGHSQLDDREASLAAREQHAASQLAEARAFSASAREQVAAACELDSKNDARAASLSQRQAEIDRAGGVLNQRIAAVRAEKQQFEQQKAAWLDANRPPEVPFLVRQLQHMQTLTPSGAAEYLDEQDSDDLYASFDPLQGLTACGKATLERYQGAAELVERWERDVEPPSPRWDSPGFG